MAWRLAKSLDRLRKQVNEVVPLRSKTDDGTIGDEAHSARESDHNPDDDGVVKAMDLTHDPLHGFDSYKFADALKASNDPPPSSISAVSIPSMACTRIANLSAGQ